MTNKKFQIQQHLTRLTKKRNKMSEYMKPLLLEMLYTEEETLATLVDRVEEGSWFLISHSGTDWNTLQEVDYSYVITIMCDDYLKGDGSVDTDRMVEYYFKEKEKQARHDDEFRKKIEERDKLRKSKD